MKNRFRQLLADLRRSGTGKMRFEGDSMRPVLETGMILTYRALTQYEVGDVVFCKVNGRFIDAHRIVDKREDGSYLIANNLGKANGWSREVFGRVVAIQPRDTTPAE